MESAKDKGRKTFNQMIDLALQFGIKDLIFKNTDRMSRNYYDLLRITELIDKHNFHSDIGRHDIKWFLHNNYHKKLKNRYLPDHRPRYYS